MRNVFALTVAMGLLGAGTAFAHHSMAMFDRDKTIVIEGTVTSFQWTNPHSWLDIAVPDGKGGSVVWGLELRSLSELSHEGWKPSTLKPGDKVKVSLHPLRNGDHGGMLGDITLPNGKVLSHANGGGFEGLTLD
jgi:Family of unknown function (DUF6152)